MKKRLMSAGLLLSGLVFLGCGKDAAPQGDPLASVKLPADTDAVMSVHGLNIDRVPALDAWGKAISKLVGVPIDLNKLLEAKLAELPKPDDKVAEWLTLFDINAEQGTTGIRSLSLAVTKPEDRATRNGLRITGAAVGERLNAANIVSRLMEEYETTVPAEEKKTTVLTRTSSTSLTLDSKEEGLVGHLSALQNGKGLRLTLGEEATAFLDADCPMARAFLPMPGTDISVRLAVAKLEEVKDLSGMVPGNPLSGPRIKLPNSEDITAVDAALGLRGTELCLNLRVEYKDAKVVAEIEAGYKTQFTQGLETMSAQMPNLKPLAELLKTNLRPTFSGNVLTVTLTLTPEEFEKAVAPALKELQAMFQGMFGGPAGK